MSNTNLIKNLKFLRKKFGYNQPELSQVLNLGKQNVSHYEIGRNTPPLDKAIQLAQLYEITLDELVWKDFEKDGIQSEIQERFIPDKTSNGLILPPAFGRVLKMIFGSKADVKVKKTLAVLSTDLVADLKIEEGNIVICEKLNVKDLDISIFYYVCEKKAPPFFGKVASISEEEGITFEINGDPDNAVTLGTKSIDEAYQICHKITKY
jgi:transcriptional regulator with XRE-family HTH domain